MKRFLRSFMTLVAVSLPVMLSAQKNADPQGTLTYCLPSTTVALEVTAIQENFYAGPYAKYAEKYFQWCILETMPLKILPDQAIDRESLYKRKFGTRDFGHNNN